MYRCRECERPINQASEVCPYCGADLAEPPPPEGEQFAKKPSLVKSLVRWGILLAALWTFLWFILPERSGNPEEEAEKRAVAALREVRSALGAYAEAQGGSYPASLEALAERVRGPAQRAQSEGYTLEYAPGSPATASAGDADGVRSYALAARPTKYGYRSFYIDETGVLRATRQNRAATAHDPPVANTPESRP